ncbi:MAG: copper resistance protein [Hyphomonas sp.]|uniref:copper-binding protein n=1 Tax=Hyphomonas sp. TaxID=87 RepID=UPI000A4B7AA8|nr:copper-binding protein [Hyphomonas sp.]MBA3070185.1 copper resistance protein [Hyphomonas sp.]MBU3922156.1 copper-binding protein [Alphaproteobacteria bacterium]MBU4060239.1 copper-binding protein [Alphaproteobacteria bacterium]MBU4162907.1 copper-binding protein [Alphaproteobacteria bacterium]
MKLSHLIIAAAFGFSAAPALALESNNMAAEMDHSGACGLPMGEGKVAGLDVKASKVTLNHGPIAALGWDAMAMDFKVAKGIDLSAFAEGDRVHILFVEDTKSASYRIEAICALDASEGLYEACMGKMHETAMAITAKSGKACEMSGMDHGSMPEMDHSAMKSMDHSQMPGMKTDQATKPSETEKISGDHSQH